MSATMDKDLFGRYFAGAPNIVIPGRTFPVQDFFLEDVLKFTGHVVEHGTPWSLSGGKGKGKGKGASDDKDEEVDVDAKKREDLSYEAVREYYSDYGKQVQTSLRNMNQDAVNYDLVVSLLKGDTLEKLALSEPSTASSKKDASKRPTGVLVFLSGSQEIENLKYELLNTKDFSAEPAKSWVLPLHGSLPSQDQKKVFNIPPPGVRKVVLATNVAETAITINDIGYVVDTCRMKEMRYDAVRRMSSLEDTVVSRTNARQRRGRAGRVAPGVAVHVGLTRYRHDYKVDDHQPPEVRRVPLEQLVLRIHATGLHLRDPQGKSASVCSELIEPPDPLSVQKAVEQLVRLGALELQPADGREKLTALGRHLANLPLEARLGKLVLFGAAFGPAATDAALTVAAALTSRSPFVHPIDMRDQAKESKKGFAEKMVEGSVGLSDHMAVLAAYREWDRQPNKDAKYSFCHPNFVSYKTLESMSDMKRSLLETLSDAGFVASGIRAKNVAKLGRGSGSDGVLLALGQSAYAEPCSPALVAALLCAALYPQVANASLSQTSKPSSEKARLRAEKAGSLSNKPKINIKDAETGKPVKVKMHLSSVAVNETTLSSPYLVFQELISVNNAYGKGESLYIRDVTPVSPLALALFGGPLVADVRKGVPGADRVLLVDGWIELAVPGSLRELVVQMRERLDALFAGWMVERDEHRGKREQIMTQHGGAELLQAVVELLSSQQETALLPPPQAVKTKKKKHKSAGKIQRQRQFYADKKKHRKEHSW
eukprot:gnl/TRDRNA2_/TRDRNA2_166939_c0_seq2.p1 gnl/TRDRNA2_/TRDRNA2_166939_c0~~gnl/TRDRNA2_/TRDRNA2_166939_c0_seq2.p1  ORF type:complete len:769 (-),score=140.91 gnl/TRDRNA2_/TRDRNA2_166939_c0_seq2:170-2476(-)